MRGLLIVVSGPSGVGKGTILKELFKDESLNLSFSISMTTRNKRPGEEDGREYFFVSQEEFKEKIKEGQLLEYARFVGNYYGTPKAYVEKLLDEGINVVLEIEVQGALQVMEKMPDCLSIFIAPPSLEELENRIRGRGTEEEDVILKRVQTAKEELKVASSYKYTVINDDVEIAREKVSEIIKNAQ